MYLSYGKLQRSESGLKLKMKKNYIPFMDREKEIKEGGERERGEEIERVRQEQDFFHLILDRALVKKSAILA